MSYKKYTKASATTTQDPKPWPPGYYVLVITGLQWKKIAPHTSKSAFNAKNTGR